MSQRQQSIELAGAKLASKHGAENVTRKMVAQEAGVTPGLVAYYFGTVEEGRKQWLARAKKDKLPMPSKQDCIRIGQALRAKPKK